MAARFRVEVVRAWPRRHEAKCLELAEGASVADAVEAVGFTAGSEIAVAVFGEVVSAAHPLRDGDRVELLRPLSIDPKEARRRRARKPDRA
jgi:uncharacterized protein